MDCVARIAARYPQASHDLRKLRTKRIEEKCEFRSLKFRFVIVAVDVDGFASRNSCLYAMKTNLKIAFVINH